MRCKECGNVMYLDDVDNIRKNGFDNYWCCTVCKTSTIEQVRCGIAIQELVHTENNGNVRDYIIKNV